MSIVQTYAPCLLLSRYEQHLPGQPEAFRSRARFRESNFDGRKDRGWNRATGQWEPGNEHGSDYLGTDWETILDVIQQETGMLRPGGPARDGPVTRPRDKRNLWRDEDGVRGFFLELEEGFGHRRSGAPPNSPGCVFHDTYEFRANDWDYVAVAYWFFYVYNWHVFFAHEGDWEHITLYFTKSGFESGREPIFVFFAAHNEGLLLPAPHPSISWVDGSHPNVFVSRWGHPSYPVPPPHRRSEYTVRWETWRQPIPAIESLDWHRYDGAWGEVGAWVHSTGPLGPFFKRERDIALVARR